MKIAIVDKSPSKMNYTSDFRLSEEPEVYHLCSKPQKKVLKRDVDLTGFDPTQYDIVILIGTEAMTYFTSFKPVTNYTGKMVTGKDGYKNYFISISPAICIFRPENKPVLEATVESLHSHITGTVQERTPCEYKLISDTQEAVEYLKYLIDYESDVFAIDTETSAFYPRDGVLLGVSLSHKVNQGVYIDADVFNEECVELLQEALVRKRYIAHNLKFDQKFLEYHLGLEFPEANMEDTVLMHYLLDERQGTHGLKTLAMKYTDMGDYDRALDEFKKTYCSSHGIKEEDFSYDLIPFDILGDYAAQDTDATIRMYHKFKPLIDGNAKLASMYRLLIKASKFLAKVEDRGIPVSRDRLNKAQKLLTERIEKVKEKVYALECVKALETDQGAIFNPNSTPQLRKLLFDYAKLKPTGKLTGTGAISTDAETLHKLSEESEVPKLILELRKLTKLKNTYVDKLIPSIDMDGRVRTGFNLISTTSGRLSSSGKFNCQQLPRDDALIKGCIKAPEGYRVVAVDMATAESWVAAAMSGDKNLQAVFKDTSGADMHSIVAHMVFDLPCKPTEVKKLYPALRQAAKAITFGILYGSGPDKVAESVNAAYIENGDVTRCSREEAIEYIKVYFDKFPRLKKWISECHTQIKSQGFIYSPFGRKRRLRNINSQDRGIAAGEVRSGFNAIIQSASSDILLMGAIDAEDRIAEVGLDAEIIMMVHDSIVAIVKEDQVEEYTQLVYECIQKDRGLMIPGAPMGVDADSEEGGSIDYSCGKLEKQYPKVASL